MFKLAVATFVSLVAAGCTSGPEQVSVEEALATPRSVTSSDGLITVTMSSSEPGDTTGVVDTFTWTAHNNSATTSIQGVTLGSHWGDFCGAAGCTPRGPTLIGMGPGCAQQGIDEIPVDAAFGVWCTPVTGVTLAPGASVTGSVALRPAGGGPADYTAYTFYDDPVTGQELGLDGSTAITNRDVVAPAPVDEQLKISASTGSPAVGSAFTYNVEIRNAGPWNVFGGVTFTDELPASVTFAGATATLGVQCSAVGQTVTCTIPDVIDQNGQGVTIALSVIAPSTAQSIVNTASIAFAAAQTDSNAANNTASVTIATR